MTERQTVCACALLGMMLCLGPLSGLLSPLQPRAEARTIAAAEEQGAHPIGPHLKEAQAADPIGPELKFFSPLDESHADPTESAQLAQRSGASSVTQPPAPVLVPVTPEAATPDQAPPTQAPPTSGRTIHQEPLLKHNQMIVFYGSPLASELGILGVFSPEEAAQRNKAEAQIYDGLNGDNRGAFGALDLIYSQVQAEPTENGLYLRYLSDDTVREYLEVADKYDLQLILDLQIGRSSVIDEIRKIERFLTDPRVHVAIDPEYAVGTDGIPLETPGKISGDDLNRMQDVLTDIVNRNHLPPKMAIVHQYLEDTIEDGGATKKVAEVDLVLNMDAFGDAKEKNEKYKKFSARPYASRRSFNIFLHHDEHVLTEEEALRLKPSPDVIFYQ